MKKHLNALKAAGFKAHTITAEDLEDGIGIETGLNLVKNGGFYTYADACKEIGIEPVRRETIETLRFSVPNSASEITDEIALAQLQPKLAKYEKSRLVSSRKGQYEAKYFWSGEIKTMRVWNVYE